MLRQSYKTFGNCTDQGGLTMANGAKHVSKLPMALAIVAVSAFFLVETAQAQWDIAVTHTPAYPTPGGKCIFNVALNARSAVKVPQLSVLCKKDPELSLVLSTRPAGPGRRTARYEYTFPESASGVWVFKFQLTAEGQTPRNEMHVVYVREARPTPGQWQSLPGSPAPTPVAHPTPSPAPATPKPAATPEPFYTLSTPKPLQTPQSRIVGPDLSIVLLDAAKEIAGAIGEKRILRYGIENVGAAAAEGMEIRYGADSRFSVSEVGTSFEPGMRLTGKTTWELEPDMKEVWVEALIQGQPDANPENSRASLPVRLTGPSAYELAVTDLTMAGAGATVRAGSNIEARLQLSNPGPGPIDRPFTVTLNGLGAQPARRTITKPIPAGKEQLVVFHARAPEADSDRLTLSAFADSGHALQERDETNNFISREWPLSR